MKIKIQESESKCVWLFENRIKNTQGLKVTLSESNTGRKTQYPVHNEILWIFCSTTREHNIPGTLCHEAYTSVLLYLRSMIEINLVWGY